jgi:hypothetical protein
MRHARRSYRPIFAQNLSTDGVRRLLASYGKSPNGAIVDDFKLQPGFLYTQVRAISARINQNYDGWPSQELKKYYRTFLGKPVFVNHQNFDPTKARGRVVAARYVENGNDKFVEVIQEIDAQRFPKLASEIRTGGLDSVSMGVEAGFTKCSICDNKATDLHDMCNHVKNHKGSYLPHAKTGKRTLVYENCYKLGFFELSYVFDPADETAVVSKVLVANKRKQPMRHYAYGEIEAPEDVDTLRDRDVEEDDSFHHYVESPPELRTPDMNNTIQQDANQEEQGLDDRRRAESVEELNPADGGKKIVEPDVAHEEVVNDFLDWCDSIEVEPSQDSLDDFSNAYHLNNEDYQAISDFLDSTESEGNGAGPTSNANQPVPHMSRRKMATYRYAEEFPPSPQDSGFDPSMGSDPSMGGGGDPLQELAQLPPEVLQQLVESGELPPEILEQLGLGGGGEEGGYPQEDFGGDEFDGGEDEFGGYDPDEDGDDDSGEEGDRDDDAEEYEDEDGDGDHDDDDHHYEDEDDDDNTGPVVDVDNDGDVEVHEARRRHALSENYARPPVPGARVRDQDGRPTFTDGDYEGWNDANYDQRDQAAVDYGDHASGLTRYKGYGPLLKELGVPQGEVNYEGRHWLPDQPEDQEFYNHRRPLPGEQGMDYDKVMESMGRDRKANNGKSRTSSQKKRRTLKGKSMARETLASRGKKAASRQRLHRFADDSGHFDSGPYGEDNQGEQEEVFLSQTPAEEAVAFPSPGDGTISNTENTLVARINSQKNSLQRDILAWNQIQRMKHAADGGLPDAETVNPELSGTDDQELRGDDFDRVQPDKVETQPRDASLKAFAAFDQWLHNTTGRTARQHGNANFIRRQAARWAGTNGYPVEVLFPALGNFLRQARRIEGGNMKRTADEKLEVAAPQDRIDVEAPVSDTTDADAQASQFDLGDFGGNAGDSIADPDLSTDSQIWAPGEGVKESNRKADGVAAIRLAEAYIRAGLKPEGEKYNLVAQFQTMRHATVTDRTRLLEAVLKTAAFSRRVTAGTSRGTAPRKPFPPGLMNGGGTRRSASVSRTAANDPSTDSDLFL